MTNKQNRLICERLAGYEVQVSPAGKYYIVTDEGTREMPDFETDWHEAMTTFIAVCRSRGWNWEISSDPGNTGCPQWVFADKYESFTGTTLSMVAHCLLQIAEGEE